MSGDAGAWTSALSAMADGAPRRYLQAGDRLFGEGDPSTDVFLIHEGLVKIVKTSVGGGESIAALRGPGGVVGEHSAIDGRPRGTGAVAASDVTLSCIDRETVVRALDGHAGFAHALLAQFTAQLRATTRDVLALATGDSVMLVAARLTELAADPMFESLRSDDDGTIVIDMPLSQWELASWAGVSLRSATGALHELRDRGLLATGRLQVEVHDPSGLAAIAGGG